MRWIALAIILLSLPLLVALIGKDKSRRDLALMAIGLIMFLSGSLQVDAAMISWPAWPGISKGIVISPIDSIALALILTRQRGADGLPFRILMAIYAVPVLLSILVSSVPLASTFVFVKLLQSILVFIAIAGELGRPGALRSLLVGMSLGLMVQAGFVIEQKLGGMVQAPGTFAHQNILGMVVEMSVLPLIAAVLDGEKNKFVYGGIGAGLIIVAGGGSRGTMGFLALGIAVLVILSLSRRVTPRKLKALGLGILAAVIVVPLGVATLKDRFGESTVITAEEERAAFEIAARAIAADYPLGAGANLYVTTANTEGYAARAGVSWNQSNRAAPVHNAYLLARAETGWIGQFTMMALFLVPAVMGLRLAFSHRTGPHGAAALGSTVVILAIGIHNSWEYAWHLQQPQALFFANLAMIAGAIRASRIEQRARRKRHRALEDDNAPMPEPAGVAA